MKKKLQQLIAEGKTNQVIKLLLESLQQMGDKELFKEVIIQSSRYEQFEKEKHLGTSTDESQGISITKINQALLRIIDRLPDDLLTGTSKNNNSNRASTKRKFLLWPWLAGLVMIIGLFAGVNKFMGLDWDEFFIEKKSPEPVTLTFYVQSTGENPEVILKNQGKLFFFLDGQKEEAPIRDGGAAIFKNILLKDPETLINIFLEVDGFKIVNNPQITLRDGVKTYYLDIASTKVAEVEPEVIVEEKEDDKPPTQHKKVKEEVKKVVKDQGSKPAEEKTTEEVKTSTVQEPIFVTLRCRTFGSGGIKVWFLDKTGKKYEGISKTDQEDISFTVPIELIGELVKVYYKKGSTEDHREEFFSTSMPFEVPYAIRHLNE